MSSSGTEDSSHLAEKADTRRDFSNFMRLVNTSNSPPSMEVSPDPANQFITGRFSAPCHQLVMVEAAYITLHHLGDLRLPMILNSAQGGRHACQHCTRFCGDMLQRAFVIHGITCLLQDRRMHRLLPSHVTPILNF